MGQHSSGSQLSRVQIGWKALEKLINETRDRINANMPVEGSGTRIEDIASGKMISYSSGSTTSPDTSSSQPQQAASGVPVTIQAFDTNNNPITITVMTDGNGASGSTLQWQPITVVDPSTCAQSTKPLLGHQ